MRTLPELRAGVLWGAVACWLASWFLPVVEGYSGWGAFRMAMSGPFREFAPVIGEDGIAQMLSALTNFVFVALCVRRFRAPVTRAALFLKVSIACLLMNLYWLVQAWRAGELRALLPGYYLWLCAFALLVVLGILNVASGRRTSKTPTAGMPA